MKKPKKEDYGWISDQGFDEPGNFWSCEQGELDFNKDEWVWNSMQINPRDAFSAKIIAHSTYYDKNHNNHDIISLVLTYPRFIHSEFLTHRVFSKNAGSSRAIPVLKIIQNILDKPSIPIFWGQNKPGMQASVELQNTYECLETWLISAWDAIEHAKKLNNLGLHKQIVNRVLEPFQIMQTVVTATDFSNFFNLRISLAAQPEICYLASIMKRVIDQSKPKELHDGEYHLPFIQNHELSQSTDDLIKISVARCARTSYLNHEGDCNIAKDFMLYNSLLSDKHASPFEHVARPYRKDDSPDSCRNFTNWVQHRAEVRL